MSVRKRSGSGGKRVLKEKIVEVYESLFRGDLIAVGNSNFWDEFFLLRPKMAALETEVGRLQADQLSAMRENLNTLFHECVAHLAHPHQIRVVYALQTLVGVIKAVYKKCVQLSGFDLVNFLIGFDRAEQEMSILLTFVTRCLEGEQPACLKDLCLQLLLVLASGTDNVSTNTLLEFVMLNSVFECVVSLLAAAGPRSTHGRAAVTVIALLVQYRKYDSSNPYILRLSILDQELVLHGYSQVVTQSLAEYTRAYEASLAESVGAGWLGAFTNMVGNMFVSEDSQVRLEKMRSHNPALLALYEIIHLNRNFITTLAHYQTEVPSTPPVPDQPELSLPTQDVNNLLVTFLEYISIAMQDNSKSDVAHSNVTLCFIILTCITEDQYCEAIMHDPNLVFKVKLHRASMRHRKPVALEVCSHGRSLVCAVLDLLLEFIKSHLMKRLPFELHLLALNCILRILAYQKRCRVRIVYNWRDLWATLIALLKFVVSNESSLNKKIDFFTICAQIFNVFVTYGDTFLPSAASYDELYYELVRCHQTFDNLHSLTLRYSTSGGEHKDTAMRITNCLVNIRAITSHFQPRIDAWLAAEQLSTPTEEQILDVVRDNYDSLTLKLQDSLDHYDSYVENPAYISFFTSLVRSIVSDTRQKIVLDDLDLQDVLQNFSSIQ